MLQCLKGSGGPTLIPSQRNQGSCKKIHFWCQEAVEDVKIKPKIEGVYVTMP